MSLLKIHGYMFKIFLITGDLSLKVNFENLSLVGQEETYISLEQFSFEAKVLKINVAFIILSNYMYIYF